MRLGPGVVVCLLLVGLAGCSSSEQTSASKPTKPAGTQTAAVERASKTAGKGKELYAWKPEGKGWHFSVVPGANRGTSFAEVTDPKQVVIGVEELKKRLSKLAVGEQVILQPAFFGDGADKWAEMSKVPVPDEMFDDLKNYCDSLDIKLYPLR